MTRASRQPWTQRARLALELPSDTQGAVMAEYVVLLGVVAIGVAVAIAGLGPLLWASYERARGILIAPIP